MKIMDEIKRMFNITDGVLKEHGRTVLQHLPGDIPVFAEFDSKFSEKTTENLTTALEAVDETAPDTTLMGDIQSHTQTVEGIMDECQEAYHDVVYFAEKAFKNNQAVLNEFKVGQLSKVDGSQVKMLKLMQEMTAAIKKYAMQLQEEGMKAEMQANILALPKKLQDSNASQESSKDQRPAGTNKRVEALNNLYLVLKQINDAAPRAFRNDPAKIKQYKLPSR